jgi:hypothetical protein
MAANDVGREHPSPGLARAGAGLALLAILGATLAPASQSALVNGGFLCVTCGGASLANVLRNVILFLPLGFFLFPLLPPGFVLWGVLPRLAVVAMAGAALSASIEFLQLFIPGRNSLLVDLLSNTAGAGLGALLAASLPLWLRPRPAARRILFAGFTLVAALAFLAPAVLLVPAPPRDALWAVWNHPLERSGGYEGPILEARLGDITLPPGRVPTGASDRFLASDTLTLRLVAAEPSPDRRGLFRVWSGPTGHEVVTMTVRGTDLSASIHYPANLLRLTRPRALAPGVMGGAAVGDTVTLALNLRPDGRIRIVGPGGVWEGGGADPSLGWSLLYFPTRIGPGGTALLGFLWCALLLFGPGFYAPGPRSAAAAGAGLLLLLAGLPHVAPFLAALSGAGWAGAVAGLLAGVAVQRAVDRVGL